MRGRVLGALLGALFVVLPLTAGAQAYTFRYAKSWGGALEDSFTDVAMDASGNTYAVGFTIPAGNTRQLLVVKYATNGNVLWSRNNIATVSARGVPKICLTGAGDVIVASSSQFDLRLDRLNATTGATLGSNVLVNGNCEIFRVIFHAPSNAVFLGFVEDGSVDQADVRSFNPTTLSQVWARFVSNVPPQELELVGAVDGALYVAREFGALALVDRLDPANGTSIWSTSLPHGFSSVFSFAVLTGTNHPIVTVNDPAASSVKLLNKTTGSVFRTDLMPQGVVTGLTPARSAGYTLRNVFPDTGSFEEVLTKGERMSRSTTFGSYGRTIVDLAGSGHTAGFLRPGGPKDLGVRHNSTGIQSDTGSAFSSGISQAIATAGTRIAVVGQVTDSVGNKQARVVHFSLTRFAANDVYGFRKNVQLDVLTPGVKSNDGLSHNVNAVLLSGPTHGTLTLGGDGRFTYLPDTDFVGEDSFTYRIGTAPGETATVDLICLKPSSLSMTSAVFGGNPIEGSLTLSMRPLSPVDVNVSDNATGAAFPGVVKVPGGTSGVVFTGITVGVAVDQNCTVTATLDGMPTTATVLIMAATPNSLTLNPSALVGGQGFVGTVTGSGPANSSGYVIAITHSGTEITTPINVTMAGGTTTVNFNGSTIARSTSITHTVTATARGVSRTANLTINPGGLFALTVAPTSIKGGTNAQGKIQTAGLAPSGGTQVSVSTNGAEVSVPPTVTVDAGQQFKTFVVTSSPVSSTTPRTIIAAFGTVIKTTTLTLTP